MPHHLAIVGPPGSGKGTQGRRLAKRLGLVHINAGALLRQIASEDSPLGRRIREPIDGGRLVADDVTNEVVGEHLRALPADQGFVLDGYPRNVGQARALGRLLAEIGRLRPRPIVVALDVPRDVLMARLRRRRDVEERADDSDAVIARRLDVYDRETAPVVQAATDWADVITIDGDQPPGAVTDEIVRRLEARRRRGRDRISGQE